MAAKNTNSRFKPKYHVKKNDTVLVITGDDKGKKGRVVEVNYTTGRVMVEGVNIISKHTRPTQQYPNGGIIKKEGAVPQRLDGAEPGHGKDIAGEEDVAQGRVVVALEPAEEVSLRTAEEAVVGEFVPGGV